MYLDIVIPFSGFMISNAQLWAELASENPWAIRLSAELFDATSVYDDRDTSPMDLSNNPSLMYNALAGNPVLDNGMTIKMSKEEYYDEGCYVLETLSDVAANGAKVCLYAAPDSTLMASIALSKDGERLDTMSWARGKSLPVFFTPDSAQ